MVLANPNNAQKLYAGVHRIFIGWNRVEIPARKWNLYAPLRTQFVAGGAQVGQGKNPCQKVDFISTPAHSVCGGRCPGGQGGTGWKSLPESGIYKHPCALSLWREVPRWDRVKIPARKWIL